MFTINRLVAYIQNVIVGKTRYSSKMWFRRSGDKPDHQAPCFGAGQWSNSST